MTYAIPTLVHEPLLIHGDCIEELRKLPSNSVDAYVSDPPSAICFMGRKWDSFKNYEPVTERGRTTLQAFDLLGMRREDSGFVVFMLEHWIEVRRVLKPGAYVVAWALPKTSDLAGLAMRLAGFDMELPLLHLFGCLADDAEILSELGWVNARTVAQAQLALCYNVTDETYQWQPIQRRVSFPYSGIACRVHGDGVDHIVTPDHRCVDASTEGRFVLAEEATEIHVPVPQNLRGVRRHVAGHDSSAAPDREDLRRRVSTSAPASASRSPHKAEALRDLRDTLLAQEPDKEPSVLLAPMLRAMEGDRPGDFGEDEIHRCQGRGGGDSRGQGSRRRENDGGNESGVDGRAQGRQGSLRSPEDHSLPHRSIEDGMEERVDLRAQGHRSPSHRTGPGKDRDRSSYRSRSDEQRPRESDVVRKPQRPQELRGVRVARSTVGRVEYDGIMWCVTVPSGAFVARTAAGAFVTGNSSMPKGKNISKALDEMAGAEREVVGEYTMPMDSTAPGKRPGNTMGYGRGLPEGVIGRDITAPATAQAERWDGYNTQTAPGFEHWLVGQEPIAGCSPERLRDLTGLDYSWTSRDVKTAKQRRKAALAWPSLVSTLPAEDLTDWTRAVLACAALKVLTLADARWQTRRGRSLRPGHPNVEQLLRDGEVVGSRETSKFSAAPIKNVAVNCLAHGCGAMHTRACEIPRGEKERAAIDGRCSQGTGLGVGETYGEGERVPYQAGNGWPKNVLLSTGGECCPAAELDRQSGKQKDGVAVRRNRDKDAGRGDRLVFGEISAGPLPDLGYGGGGGASRFYTQLPIDELDHRFRYAAKARKRYAGLRSDITNDHNTIKTVALMRWIMRLVVPTAKATGGLPGVVLSTFLGSGTDGVAAIAEGFRFIGIERDRGHFELAHSKIYAAIGSPEEAAKANELAPVGAQLGLL